MPHPRCWYSNGSLVLCHDSTSSSSATIEGHHSSTENFRSNSDQQYQGAVQDISDDNFWKCMYILLRGVFLALRALWYCDSNRPCMEKIYYLSHRITVAIENSQDDLNDERLFGSLNTNRNLIEEGNIVLGSNVNNSANNDENERVFEDAPPVSNGTDDEDSNDEAQTPSNATMSFA